MQLTVESGLHKQKLKPPII